MSVPNGTDDILDRYASFCRNPILYCRATKENGSWALRRGHWGCAGCDLGVLH